MMTKPATTAFRAEIGDLLIISGHRIGEAEQLAEIVEVLGEPGHEHYRVRWEDGHQTTIYPGTDATVRRRREKEES